jgi:LmbE family N-acetylglucosaminyl deacetylase
MTVRIMVISAHPDDETLGCGGTLLRHANEGASLHWVVATEPNESFDATWRQRRAEEIRKVAAAYPMGSVDELGLPAASLDRVPLSDLIERLRQVVLRVRPDVIYVVHGGDVHGDHAVVFDATMAVFKPFRIGWPHAIFSFECASSTNLAAPRRARPFVAQSFVDIGPYIDRKLEILSIYESEVPPAPHPRSQDAVRALARYRGTTVSFDYAETFELIRQVR